MQHLYLYPNRGWETPRHLDLILAGRMRPELPFKKRRSRAKAGPAFVFINASNLPAELEEQDVRTRIRKQAARSGRKSHRQQSTKNNESNVAQRSRALVLWR